MSEKEINEAKEMAELLENLSHDARILAKGFLIGMQSRELREELKDPA